MTVGGDRVHYQYNAFGQPVIRKRNGAVERYFLWDGDDLLAELDASFNRVSEHVYFGTDVPFVGITGPTTPVSMYYVQQDELGNVMGDRSGLNIDQSIAYDSRGRPTVTGNTAKRLFWKGLRHESDGVDLYYMRARWYDPEIGRFISEDPLGLSAGINQHAFAGNDPINGWDPSGTWHCVWEPYQYSYQAGGTIYVVAGWRWHCPKHHNDLSGPPSEEWTRPWQAEGGYRIGSPPRTMPPEVADDVTFSEFIEQELPAPRGPRSPLGRRRSPRAAYFDYRRTRPLPLPPLKPVPCVREGASVMATGSLGPIYGLKYVTGGGIGALIKSAALLAETAYNQKAYSKCLRAHDSI